jgi:hypothetical protein
VPAHFGLSSPLALAEAIHNQKITRRRVIELPRVVFAEAAEDAVAAAIISRLADEVVALARAALTRLELTQEPVEVVLGGGLLQAADGPLSGKIAAGLAAVGPHITVRAAASSPVVGAALLGLDELAAPPEAQNLTAAANKSSFNWSAATSATQYDVVRGSLAAFPVGPGGGDESCFDNLAGPTLSDPTAPAPGSGYWYLSRGENACGIGTWGNATSGPRARRHRATAPPSSTAHKPAGCDHRGDRPHRTARRPPPRSPPARTTPDGSPAATHAHRAASETTAHDHTR